MSFVGWFSRKRRRNDIISELVDHPDGLTAVEISKLTGYTAGHVYPFLAHYEASGLLESWFEAGPYPRRRKYKYVGI